MAVSARAHTLQVWSSKSQLAWNCRLRFSALEHERTLVCHPILAGPGGSL